MRDECPDCWHRWKYHGPEGSNGCAAPACRCSEPDALDVYRCADGSLIHDFKGQTRCPACGIDGIRIRPKVDEGFPDLMGTEVA